MAILLRKDLIDPIHAIAFTPANSMHHTRRPGMALAIRISSFFVIFSRLAFFSFLISLAYSWYERSELSYWIILATFLTSLFTCILFAFWSSRCLCQLCLAKLLSRAKCNENHNAKKLFGSYRARLALSALTLGRFRCYFCGEEFSLDLPPEKPNTGPVKNRPVTTIRRSGSLPRKH